jgi:ribosomal-protein-alanine N-acetyltransferase
MLVRRPLASDAQGIFHCYAGDAEVTRYLTWPTHRTVADTYAFIEWSDAEWSRRPAGPYLLFCRDGNCRRVLGSTGLVFKDPATAEVGYALAQGAWSQGYATEALQAMVEVARLLGIEHLQASCHADNAASAHVLEKCGFRSQGVALERTLFPNLDGGMRCPILHYSTRIEQQNSGGYFSTSTPRQNAT